MIQPHRSEAIASDGILPVAAFDAMDFKEGEGGGEEGVGLPTRIFLQLSYKL